MSELSEPPFPVLSEAAVTLLAEIRDHLDVPLYPEGDKAARRAWQATVEIRVADVIGLLGSLLAVSQDDAVEVTQQLREYRAEGGAL